MATSLILTLNDAEEYFNTRLWTDAWDTANESTKLKALHTAFNRLNAEYNLVDIPDTPSKQVHAICDMALFLLQSGEGLERRAGLQAQGVVKAGLVEETYKADMDSMMIPASVVRMLKEWKVASSDTYAGLVSISRNENL